jgi:hypothetical protein
MNGRFQMQGGKNWFLPKEMNTNRFFWDSHWLEIWSNHFYPSMGPNGGSVAMDSEGPTAKPTTPALARTSASVGMQAATGDTGNSKDSRDPNTRLDSNTRNNRNIMDTNSSRGGYISRDVSNSRTSTRATAAVTPATAGTS